MTSWWSSKQRPKCRRPHREQTHQTGQPRWTYWALHVPMFPTGCHPPRHRGNCLLNPGPGPPHEHQHPQAAPYITPSTPGQLPPKSGTRTSSRTSASASRPLHQSPMAGPICATTGVFSMGYNNRYPSGMHWTLLGTSLPSVMSDGYVV